MDDELEREFNEGAKIPKPEVTKFDPKKTVGNPRNSEEFGVQTRMNDE